MAWAVLGPFMGFSDTWQLIISTINSVGTLIMVFIIQNSQNRADQALHAKLDALIHFLDVPNDYKELDKEDLEHIEELREQVHEHQRDE